MLLTLAKELKPHVWLNVHSGMYALFTPYDHKGHVPNTTGEAFVCQCVSLCDGCCLQGGQLSSSAGASAVVWTRLCCCISVPAALAAAAVRTCYGCLCSVLMC